MNSSPTTPMEKVCRKCGIPQPLERFPFRKAEQTYRNPCKACRAVESRARRRDPEQGQVIREREEVRNHTRREAIKQWQREHPDQLRPGRQRRWRRRAAKLAAARAATVSTTQRPPHAELTETS